MMGFFVTGTDTDAGKTHVTRALLLAARSLGLRCAGYKPIESGCPNSNAPGHDASALAAAAGTAPLTTYTFLPAIAPHLAARQAGITIDVDHICERTSALQQASEFLLVEGAGGFLVPLSEHCSTADLAAGLQLPLLLVAADRLGAINHTLLTIEAARHRNLDIRAVILSEVTAGAGHGLENRNAIEEYGQVPVFELAHCTGDAELAHAAQPILEALRRSA